MVGGAHNHLAQHRGTRGQMVRPGDLGGIGAYTIDAGHEDPNAVCARRSAGSIRAHEPERKVLGIAHDLLEICTGAPPLKDVLVGPRQPQQRRSHDGAEELNEPDLAKLASLVSRSRRLS
jgi:hypothetical protein